MHDAVLTLLYSREHLPRTHAAHNNCPHPRTRKKNVQATPSTAPVNRAEAPGDDTGRYVGPVSERVLFDPSLFVPPIGQDPPLLGVVSQSAYTVIGIAMQFLPSDCRALFRRKLEIQVPPYLFAAL